MRPHFLMPFIKEHSSLIGVLLAFKSSFHDGFPKIKNNKYRHKLSMVLNIQHPIYIKIKKICRRIWLCSLIIAIIEQQIIIN